MVTKYIFTKDDLAKEYIDSLDFDPLYWLKKDEETCTMGDLFKLAEPCEDNESDRSIRYSGDETDDICFEILFEDVGKNSDIVGSADEHTNWYSFYLDRDTGTYYMLTVAADL